MLFKKQQRYICMHYAIVYMYHDPDIFLSSYKYNGRVERFCI